MGNAKFICLWYRSSHGELKVILPDSQPHEFRAPVCVFFPSSEHSPWAEQKKACLLVVSIKERTLV